VVTFGNGVPMSLRVARRLAEHGIRIEVLDLRWLVPLPLEQVHEAARRVGRVLVVDETRHAGGIGEGVLTGLVERGFAGPAARVSSVDSFIPLGPAAAEVLLSEDEIEKAATTLAARERTPS
jgi:2-oxoisovalerate dehydrogenase E1 component